MDTHHVDAALTQENQQKQENQFKALQNSIYLGIGLSNLPEFHGSPKEDVNKFLKEFSRATSALTPEQKCVALKKSLVDDASIFSKNYLKVYLQRGDWKTAKNELKNRFSLIEPSLLYRTELKNMVYEPEKSSLLGYIDRYANLYRKIHSEVKDKELIQDISLNLGNNVILKLNQLASDWKSLDNFETFRTLVSRLERDIMSLETALSNQITTNMANTVNKLVSSALETPIKGMQEIINQLTQKTKTEPATENLAAVKYVQYPEPPQNRYRQDYNKKREREWEETRDRQRFRRDEGKRDEDRNEPTMGEKARDLKKAYEDKFGKVPGICYYCRGYHFRRHCPFDMNLKEREDRR